MGYTFFKAEIRSYEKKHFYQEVLCFGNLTFEKHNLCIRRYLSKNTLTEDFAKKCIEMGLSAADTPYYEDYRNYWNPIMEEQHKKADSI